VLLVEDEPGVRRLAASMLRRNGHSVLCAASGEEAIEIFQSHGGTVDLVLTDIVMTGMSGVELARQIHKRQPGARVLFMSGYADNAAQSEIPPHAVLSKPFTADALRQRVRDTLESTAAGSK
jgi:CheY-like chemotaxis protein